MNFATMLEAAKTDPAGADFGELRRAWVQSPESLHTPEEPEQGEAMQAAMEENDHTTVAKMAGEMLIADPISIRLHLLAATANELAGDLPASELHKQIARGLVKSILDSGDGMSIESAFHVVSVEEEYAVISLFGAEPRSQEMRQHEGHAYDVISVVSEDGTQEGEIFFNVDEVVSSGDSGGCCGGNSVNLHGAPASGGCCGGKAAHTHEPSQHNQPKSGGCCGGH